MPAPPPPNPALPNPPLTVLKASVKRVKRRTTRGSRMLSCIRHYQYQGGTGEMPNQYTLTTGSGFTAQHEYSLQEMGDCFPSTSNWKVCTLSEHPSDRIVQLTLAASFLVTISQSLTATHKLKQCIAQLFLALRSEIKINNNNSCPQ